MSRRRRCCCVGFGDHVDEGVTGVAEFVTMAEQLRVTSGPIQYWNRTQYFGERVFAETHTACFLDEALNQKRVLVRPAMSPIDRFLHPEMIACMMMDQGRSLEVLAVCTLNDDGLIVRFEEFADDAFMKELRPAPEHELLGVFDDNMMILY